MLSQRAADLGNRDAPTETNAQLDPVFEGSIAATALQSARSKAVDTLDLAGRVFPVAGEHVQRDDGVALHAIVVAAA